MTRIQFSHHHHHPD
ncbi:MULTISPECIES: his operon leader peptide [Serratia]|nr:his operon leader peptide [Serratia proteamaculans]